MSGPKSWLRRLRQWLLWLWHHEATVGQKARGLAAGVFMGCFPIFGLQTLLGIALASLVRGNHILAAAGTWISNPLTYIPFTGSTTPWAAGCWAQALLCRLLRCCSRGGSWSWAWR